MTPLRELRSHLAGRRNLRAHAWQTLANYFQQGFGVLFGVVLARILAPADFGAVALATATVILALLPLNWSLCPTLVADGGRTPGLHATAAGFGGSIVLLRLTMLLGLVGWMWSRGQHQFATLCLLVGIAEAAREVNNVQRTYLEGMGQFRPNLVSVLANIGFCLLVVIPAALLGGGIYALTLPGLGGWFVDFFIYRSYSGRPSFVRPVWRLPAEHFQNGFWMWLGNMGEIALLRVDKWFTGRFVGQEALGHYHRASGYAPLAQLVLNSLIGNPTVVGLANAPDGLARRRLFWKTAAILGAAGLVNWLLLRFYAGPIVRFVFGPAWEPSIPIFKAFAGLSLCYFIAWLPVTAMLAARRYRPLALVRCATVALLAALLWINRESALATTVAWSLQAVLVFQGIILFVIGRRFLSATHSRSAENP